jgi:hypothetical protein
MTVDTKRNNMAVWQVEFAIVPRAAIEGRRGVPLSRLIETDWWSGADLPHTYAQQLTAIASLGPASAPDVQTWGVEDGNRVDVWSHNGKASRMTAHVDVRRLDSKFGAMLIQFARVANAVLLRRDGLVVEPIVGAFGAALRNSEAWRYASDPAAFLASHADTEEDE